MAYSRTDPEHDYCSVLIKNNLFLINNIHIRKLKESPFFFCALLT